MQQVAKGSSLKWFDALVPVNLVACAMMLCAGIYLLDPSVFETAIKPDPGRWTIVALLLFYAAAVLAIGTVSPAHTTGHSTTDLVLIPFVGNVALMCAGLMLVALGGQALFMEPPNFWASGFGLVGILCLLTGHAGEAFEKLRDAQEQPNPDDSEAVLPNEGAPSPTSRAFASLLMGGIAALALAYLILVLSPLVWLYFRVSGAVFKGEHASLANLSLGLLAVSKSVLPIVFALGVTMIIVLPGITLVILLVQRVSLWGAYNSGRDLSPDEAAFIEACDAKVTSYIAGRRKSGWIAVATYAFPIMFIATLILVAITGIQFLVELDRQAMEPPRAHTGIYVLVFESHVAEVLFVFLSIFLAMVPGLIILRLFPILADATVRKNARDVITVRGRLINFVRTGRLIPGNPFNPAKFIRDAIHSMEPYVLYPLAIVALINLVAWQLDRGNRSLVTDNYIEVVNYWTQSARRFSYADAERVEVECWFGKKGSLDVGYTIVLPEGDSVQIIRQEKLASFLSMYEAIDRKLIASGAKFDFDMRKPLFADTFYAYDPGCVDELGAHSDATANIRIRKLFRVDEWNRRFPAQ